MMSLNIENIIDKHSSLKHDENLVTAFNFLEQWHAGATQFTFYSSGSTGNPKAIILSRVFITESSQRTIDLFDIKSSDSLLLALNTSFIGGIMMIARALIAKCKLVYIAPQNISHEVLQNIPQIKLASFVPSQVSKILSSNRGDSFPNIDIVLIGGAPIDEQLQLKIYNISGNCKFYHSYGMAETASHVALKNLTLGEKHYTAIKNYSFDIDSRDCLMINYSGNSQFSIQTNDIIKLISPSTFEWISRVDWVINSGGIKFNLESAEVLLLKYFSINHPNLKFTSYKSSDEQWGDKWILIIEGNNLAKKEEELLCTHCKVKLGKYAFPKEIRYTKKIVYLSSGKVDRFNTYINSI